MGLLSQRVPVTNIKTNQSIYVNKKRPDWPIKH